jgi:hypothetical protein
VIPAADQHTVVADHAIAERLRAGLGGGTGGDRPCARVAPLRTA